MKEFLAPSVADENVYLDMSQEDDWTGLNCLLFFSLWYQALIAIAFNLFNRLIIQAATWIFSVHCRYIITTAVCLFYMEGSTSSMAAFYSVDANLIECTSFPNST
jgi:hypothetical protein